MKAAKAWEVWGAKEPYFATLTDDQFLRSNLDPRQREAFFQSGQTHVEGVLNSVGALCGEGWGGTRVLDFGCGPGRLVIPFAQRFERVTGVDVSPSMIAEAQRNCGDAGVKNVRLLQTDLFLDDDERFDLVHSILVFQHIPPVVGQRLLAELLYRLEVGGVLALQLIFSRREGRFRGFLSWAKRRLPYLQDLAIRFGRHPDLVAPMEMNPYDLNRLLEMFQQHGIHDVRMRIDEDSDLGSVMIVGSRSE